jgi:hypothetical protein
MRRSRPLELESLEGKRLQATLALPVLPQLPAAVAPMSQGLELKLSTDHQTYRRGQPVEITLTVSNTSSHALSFAEGPSVDGFFVTQGWRRIWSSNSGLQPMFVIERTLEPGESVAQSAVWTGHASTGPHRMAVGRLTVGSDVAGAQPVGIFISRR